MKKQSRIYLMIFIMLISISSSSFAAIQKSLRSQYKNDTWNVVFMDLQDKYEDKKDFSVREGYVLHIDVTVNAGSLGFLIEGRKSKDIYLDREFTADKNFYIDSNENVSVTVTGTKCKGNFSAEVIKREAAKELTVLKDTSAQSESSQETQVEEKTTASETTVIVNDKSVGETIEEQPVKESSSVIKETETQVLQVDWYTELLNGKEATIYESFSIVDKAVTFVEENENLFLNNVDRDVVEGLENKDLHYSTIAKDIDRYANQIISFRATIDNIEEVQTDGENCLTVMKVHYGKKQMFSLVFVGSVTEYTQGQEITVYGITLGNAVLNGAMQEESLVFLVSYAEKYKKAWYKIF